MQNSRRKFIQQTILGSYLGAQGGLLFAESPTLVQSPSLKKAKIVIVGAGFGGCFISITFGADTNTHAKASIASKINPFLALNLICFPLHFE